MQRCILVLSAKIESDDISEVPVVSPRAHPERAAPAFVSSLDRESACGKNRPQREQCEYIIVSDTKTKGRAL